MAKYMKKSIPVEAVQYNKGLEDGIDDMHTAVNSGLNVNFYKSPLEDGSCPFILTLEGKHYISKGDYIITGINGERYPCKEEIFLKSYELIT